LKEKARAALTRKLSILALLGIAALMAAGAPVWASANVSCRIDDANLSFELEAIAGRGGPIVQVQVGTIAIKPKAAKLTAPQLTFDRPHIVQQWDLDGDLRLQIVVTDETSKENVSLVIYARLNKATDKHYGRYVLKITRANVTKELKGRIKECEVG
jgi:hypothetical protein